MAAPARSPASFPRRVRGFRECDGSLATVGCRRADYLEVGMADDGIMVEFHESHRAMAPLHIANEHSVLLIAHDDGSVTCVKDRNGVLYRRRPRNQLPEGHRFAVEDAEAT